MYICLPCFLDYTVSTTVCNLNSSCWDSLAQIEARSSSIVWYKLLRVKVHFSWTKLGFADPYSRNLNFVCRSGMHIETLPVPKTDFQLPAEVAVTWQKRAAIFDLAILARRSRRLPLGDITAYGRVQEWPSRKRLGTRLGKMGKNDKTTASLRMRCSHGNGLNPENETW